METAEVCHPSLDSLTYHDCGYGRYDLWRLKSMNLISLSSLIFPRDFNNSELKIPTLPPWCPSGTGSIVTSGRSAPIHVPVGLLGCTVGVAYVAHPGVEVATQIQITPPRFLWQHWVILSWGKLQKDFKIIFLLIFRYIFTVQYFFPSVDL